MKVVKLSLLAGAAAVLIAAMAGAGGHGAGTVSQPGSSAVYARIASETDCSELQAEFDTAEANHKRDLARHNSTLARVSTAYMGAADTRMRAIGCY